MASIDLAQIPSVALPFMNGDHQEEARLLNELIEAVEALRAGAGSKQAVLERFAALDVHTREHFEREEEAMRESEFPPLPVHKGEHDRVLAELAAEGKRFAQTGDAERLHAYATRVVPQWFFQHIHTMDNMTARWVAENPV